jgi:hypothetical protein
MPQCVADCGCINSVVIARWGFPGYNGTRSGRGTGRGVEKLKPGMKEKPLRSPATLLRWLPIAAMFLLFAVISFTVTTEDAYISFRYAENIAAGHGIVFNAGEERVEGYSNPLWVAILAITSKLGLYTVTTARCLGLLFGALTLLEIMLLLGLVSRDRTARAVLAAIVLATAPPYLFWSQTGLENGLFLYLLMLGWRLATAEDVEPDRFPYSGIAFLLLAVTRPEGIMYAVIFGAWKLVNLARSNKGKDIRRFLVWAAMIVIPFCAFLLWRHWVFDAWVPNTFFAKVNNGMRANLRVGLRYLVGFLNHTLWTPVVVPLVLAVLRGKPMDAAEKRVLLACIMIALGLAAFVLYVGGDIHPNDRFGVPFILIASVASFVMVPATGKGGWWKQPAIWIFAALVAGNLCYSFPPAYGIEPPMLRPPNFLTANVACLVSGRMSPGDIWARFANPPVDALEFVGRDLKENPEMEGLLAADQCGKIPYFSELPTLDLLGLNNPKIAHIVHSVSTWDRYATEVLSGTPRTFVMVYRSTGHFISRYYIENTVMSEPFRRRYRLDAIYHIDYCFYDNSGIERRFPFELIRYRAISEEAVAPPTEEEIEWLRAHDPADEDPDGLSREVEEFRSEHGSDGSRVIYFRVDLN